MDNRYRQAEKFWRENMMDEKVTEERHRINQEYLDRLENDISRYWSNANNWLLDLVLFVFKTFDNALKKIPEDEQSSPLYKVISELHQRSVNHAKTTSFLLKGDPIDTAVFQWRSLYEAEVRTTFFFIKRSHSLKEAQKIAERLLRYSELMRKKKILEDKFIQKTEEEKKKKTMYIGNLVAWVILRQTIIGMDTNLLKPYANSVFRTNRIAYLTQQAIYKEILHPM